MSDRLVIDGGALSPVDPWVPKHVIDCGGIRFIELSRADRKLQRFVGVPGASSCPFAKNSFFDALVKARTVATERAIWKTLKASDPMLSEGDVDTVVAQHKKDIDECDLPRFVEIELPALAYEGEDGKLEADAITMKVIPRLCAGRLVAIEVTPETMHYIRVALLNAQSEVPMEGTPAEKRTRASAVAGVKGVCVDKRRKTVYLMCVHREGEKPQRMQKKPDEWEPQMIKQAAEELRDEMIERGAWLARDSEPTVTDEGTPEKMADSGADALAGGATDEGAPEKMTDSGADAPAEVHVGGSVSDHERGNA